mmetsp:Transcript_16753/g.47682  ORF Transcript_16753/g.47682 Transcript_16753/m.47682 type:complete len:139 (+) Transcript_16753:522-938(+)
MAMEVWVHVGECGRPPQGAAWTGAAPGCGGLPGGSDPVAAMAAAAMACAPVATDDCLGLGLGRVRGLSTIAEKANGLNSLRLMSPSLSRSITVNRAFVMDFVAIAPALGTRCGGGPRAGHREDGRSAGRQRVLGQMLS